jgi:hypothetical protein
MISLILWLVKYQGGAKKRSNNDDSNIFPPKFHCGDLTQSDHRVLAALATNTTLLSNAAFIFVHF